MVALKPPALSKSAFPSADYGVDVFLHVRRAIDCYANGDFESARREWDEALLLEPEDARIHLGRALIMINLGRLPDAMADLDAAQHFSLPLDSLAEFHAARAIALHGLGRQREAIAELDQFLENNADSDLTSLRKAILSEALQSLVRSGLARWAGGKPELLKRPAKLKSGKSASDYIIKERDRLR